MPDATTTLPRAARPETARCPVASFPALPCQVLRPEPHELMLRWLRHLGDAGSLGRRVGQVAAPPRPVLLRLAESAGNA